MTSITTCGTSSRVVEAGGAVHMTAAVVVRDAVARVSVQGDGTTKTCAPLACTPSPSPSSADLLDEHAWLLPLLRACVDADDDDDDDDGACSNSNNNNNNNSSSSGADVGGITRSNSDCIDGSGNSNNTSATLSLLPMPVSVPTSLPLPPPPPSQQQQQQAVVGCVNNRVTGNDSNSHTTAAVAAATTTAAAAVTTCATAAAGPTTANNARAPTNPMQYRNVYISGLPTYFRSEDLRAMCQPYGRIEALKLCVTQKSHPSKTYCFVLFRTEAAAAACIAAKNGSYLAGHFLQARYADASATPQPVDTSKVAIIPPTPRPAIPRSAVPAAATSMLLMHAPPGCLVAPPMPPPSPLQATTTAAAAATTLGMAYATSGMPLFTPHLGLPSTTLLPPPPPPPLLARQHTAQAPLATAPATAAAMAAAPVVAATAPDAGMMPAPLLYYPAAMPFAGCAGAATMPPTHAASVALQHMPVYAPPCVVQPPQPQPQSLTHMYTPCPPQPPQHMPRRATYML